MRRWTGSGSSGDGPLWLYYVNICKNKGKRKKQRTRFPSSARQQLTSTPRKANRLCSLCLETMPVRFQNISKLKRRWNMGCSCFWERKQAWAAFSSTPRAKEPLHQSLLLSVSAILTNICQCAPSPQRPWRWPRTVPSTSILIGLSWITTAKLRRKEKMKIPYFKERQWLFLWLMTFFRSTCFPDRSDQARCLA